MIKYCLIFVFLLKSYFGNTAVPGQLAYADSLFSNASYQLAAMEYEHTYFLSTDNIEKATSLLRKSYCLKNLYEFTKAYETLQRISMSNIPDSTQFSIRYEKILVSHLAGDEQQAETGISDLDYATKDSLLLNKSLLLKIIVKNELQKWNDADSLLRVYVRYKQIILAPSDFTSLLKKPRLLNPKTMKVISYFIPGSGQICTGHVFRGISSIAFQGTFLLYAIVSIRDGFYISGVTTGLGIFQMFYFGGTRYAYYLAEKNNAKKLSIYNKKIKDFLLKTERGKE